MGTDLAVEVKASSRIHSADLRGLRALKDEALFKKRIVVCMEEQSRCTDDGIFILPWQQFLTELWQE